MKRLISALLILTVLLSFGSLSAFAEFQSEEPVTRNPGYCGEQVTWTYADGVLTLEGTGPTDDFYAGQPWAAHITEIEALELKGSISYIGAYAFPDYDNLKKVDFGEGLIEIGQAAFSGCDGLTLIELPASFRIFGEDSFSHCKNLKEFRFQGGMPKFKLNCLWNTYATLIYPASHPWPLEHLQQLEEAFQGRIEFIDSEGRDPITAQEATEAPTAEPTQPATEEAVILPTETETEAATIETTEAPTQAHTETEAPETTVPPTTEAYVELPAPEEPRKPEGSGMGLKGAALIAIMVISGGGALLMLGRMGRNHKKDFTGDFSEILLEDERKPSARKKSTASRKAAPAARRKKGGKYSK